MNCIICGEELYTEASDSRCFNKDCPLVSLWIPIRAWEVLSVPDGDKPDLHIVGRLVTAIGRLLRSNIMEDDWTPTVRTIHRELRKWDDEMIRIINLKE